jgi:CBS domain-containing protein
MIEDLLKLARHPAVSIGPEATVQDLVELLSRERVGAAVVLDRGKLVGIVSERDVIVRCMVARHDPGAIKVVAIMTTDVRTTHDAVKSAHVLELMLGGGFRHMPVVDAEGSVVGMLSLRHLLQHRMAELDRKNADLLGFISADGAGG